MPSAVVAPARGRALVAALAVAWLVGLAVFVATTVLVGRDSRSEALDTWLYSALALGAAALAVLRVVLVRGERRLWSLNALALCVYTAGDVTYSFWVVGLDPEPYPSPADGLWLAYYVLAVAFLVALLRRHARDVSRSTAVDGVVVGLGAAAATAAVSFDTILAATEGGGPETVATLAYPVGALVLLGTAGAALAVLGWRVGRQWWALVLGGLLFAAADTVYAFLSATDGYTDGGPVDAMWLAALGLQAGAAWLRPRTARHAADRSLATLVVPLAFAGAALVLLVLEHFQRLSLLALVLAAGTVAAALLRITLTVEETRQLAVVRVQAVTDDLTGLPNRRRLDQSLRAATTREGRPVGLLMLDLDRFKDVNDALGHPVGDALLVEVSRRLQGATSGEELVARLGGDEFAVLLPGVRGEELLERARAVAALLGPPVDLGHISLHVSTSVGAAAYPDHAGDASHLMRAADVAMYRAKRRGTGVALYESSADTATPEHLRVIEEFRTGFAESGVRCVYRPVRDLRDGRVLRWLAEPRWTHPRLGDVPTRELLEMVERTGLVREHTTHVLHRALADLPLLPAPLTGRHGGGGRGDGAGGERVVVVRLSAVELLDARLPGTVVTALERSGTGPGSLLLECEESTLVAEPERCTRALLAVRRVGVRIGVTGHGTGPTSLPHLRSLPLSSLAVDGALVGAVQRDSAALAVLKAAVVLGHELGVEVVASGVPDERLLDELAALGVDAVDGPALGDPVEPAVVTTASPGGASIDGTQDGTLDGTLGGSPERSVDGSRSSREAQPQ
ncbi:putative bifunctional diguanylate cyclase/phosphodiesterase [Aquipuribacter sp. SD81]|uniref:putative bifunctional diguanylate cyclase/phosphodiesterase n=1 Tax=Aquipuribacter sp. SD81 TaxID=3127703 RepID=UPI00301B57B4